MEVQSISNALGVGSGIDITALVSSLVDNQFAIKNKALTAQGDALTAQISGVAKLKGGITGFSAALSSLVKSGSLATAPSSSNSSILQVTGLPGAKLSGLSASIEVRQLASAQSAATGPITDRTASLGTGTLTLTLGTATVGGTAMTGFTPGSGTPIDIVIDADHSSLDDIAQAINAAGAGVTASIVSDSDGARLTLKGKTGAAQAFTLSATEDAGAPGLSTLNVGPGATGTTLGTMAQDSIVAIDGVALKRTSNSINDLIAGVQLDLASAAPGTNVTLGAIAPSANISQAVNDFVATFNELQAVIGEETNITTGTLHNDPAANAMSHALSQLTLTTLVPAGAPGAPRTLAEIGVATNRDGTLTVDADRLSTALAKWPDVVEAMFADGKGASGAGISGALNAISDTVTDKTYGLGASETRYTKAQAALTEDQADAVDRAEALRTQLTQQFASMDARVAAYKSTQAFLEQQVDAWNAAKN